MDDSIKDNHMPMDDSVEGTFDVDVVGLTDLVDFKSDAELFDFESGEEFGLFADEVDRTLQQQSTVNNGENEPYTNKASSHLIPHAMNKIPSHKLTKKPRKNKFWNEMEKDLFLKGLELFGQNWRKISKFIATKTITQVKVYHKEWAATANVIPDSVNIANDSSIYLPLGNHDKTCIMARLSGSDELAKNKSCNEGTTKIKSSSSDNLMDIHSRKSSTDGVSAGISFGEGIVVSPLHDWDLGSQVSVSGTEEPPSALSGSNVCQRKFERTKPQRKRKIQNSRTLKKKNVNCIKIKSKLTKRSSSQARKKNVKILSQNINNQRPVRSSVILDEGQIVHLNKNESEDSDVNIDDSEDEATPTKDQIRVEEVKDREWEKFATLSTYENSSKYKHCNVDDDESDSLSDDEKLFYLRIYQSVEEMSLLKYTSIRDHIISAWDRQKPFILTKERVTVELKPHCSELVNKIYDFLCLHKFINYSSVSDSVESHGLCVNSAKKRVLRKRKLNKSNKDISNGKLYHDVVQKGGGVTQSHDESGAVIDTLHIPEASGKTQDSKKSTVLPHVKLLNFLSHDPDTPAPFTLVIYPQAVITLDLHSHSSFSEVIGLLGGFLDQRKSVLHITSAVPTNSSSSGIHCEMCPVSQIEALETIRRSEREVVGWYHSHPSFRPNPSQRDLDTQAHLQNWFKRNCAPFVGMIISSFCPISNSESSEIRCFILDTPPSQHSKDLRDGSYDVELPYKLQWTVQSETELKWEEIERSVEDVLQKSKEQPNAVSWKKEWKNGASYLDKFVTSLKLLLPVSMKELVNFIKDFVIEF